MEAFTKGWDRLVNGELLKAAEDAGFDLLLTAGKNMKYPQNLKDRRIAIVVPGNSNRPVVHRYIDRVIAVVNAAAPGSYTEVDIKHVSLTRRCEWPSCPFRGRDNAGDPQRRVS